MKIWNEFGTEHSHNLVMIGTFSSEAKASETEELFATITKQIELDIEEDRMDVGDRNEDISDDLRQLIREKEPYLMIAPSEYQDFAYEYQVERDGNRLMLSTDEIDVSAFLKLMLAGHAKIEIFSAHDFPETESENNS